MTTTIYDVADQVGLEMTFYNALDVATDPTAVTFTLTPPSGGTALAYTYGVNSQLVRLGAGHYSVDYIVPAEGIYSYSFSGTGLVTQHETAQFYVQGPAATLALPRGYTSPARVAALRNRTFTAAQAIHCTELILVAEETIDELLGRSWAGLSPTTERQYLRSPRIFLVNAPLTSITSVGLAATPLDVVDILDPSEYSLVDPTTGEIYISRARMYGSGWPGFTWPILTVVYAHGGPVPPARVSLAAAIMVDSWMARATGQPTPDVKSYSVAGELSVTFRDSNNPGTAIPDEALSLLDLVPHQRFA